MAQRGPPIPYPYLKNQFGESIVAVESHYGPNRGRFIVTITRGGYNDLTFAVTTADGIWRDPPRYEYIKSETKEDRLRTNAGVLAAATLTQEAKTTYETMKKAKRVEAKQPPIEPPSIEIPKSIAIPQVIKSSSSSSSASPEIQVAQAAAKPKPPSPGSVVYQGDTEPSTGRPIYVEHSGSSTKNKNDLRLFINYKLVGWIDDEQEGRFKIGTVGGGVPQPTTFKFAPGPTSFSKNPTDDIKRRGATTEKDLTKAAETWFNTHPSAWVSPPPEAPPLPQSSSSSSRLISMYSSVRGAYKEAPPITLASSLSIVEKEVIPIRKSSSSLKMSVPLIDPNAAKLQAAMAYGRAPKNTISSYFSRTRRPESTAITVGRTMSVELKDALNRGKRVFCLWTIGLTDGQTAVVAVYGDMGTPSFFVNGEMTDIENFRIAIKRNRRNLAASMRRTEDSYYIKLIEDFLKIETQKIPDYESMKNTLETNIRRYSEAGDTIKVIETAKALRKLKKDSSIIQEITKADKQVTLPYTDSQYEKYAYQNLITQKELESYMVANEFNNVQARDCLNIMSNTYNRSLYETAATLVRRDPTEDERRNPDIMNIYNAVRGLVPARKFIKPISVEPIIIKGAPVAQADPMYHLAPQAPVRRMDPNPQRGGLGVANYASGIDGKAYGYDNAPPFPYVGDLNNGTVYFKGVGDDQQAAIAAARQALEAQVDAEMAESL